MNGIGTDIIEVDRIRANIENYGEKFLDKILTLKEKSQCQLLKDPTLHVAGRFAAKEAISKALGTGFGEELGFHDIEIFNNPFGRPEVTLSIKANRYFNNPLLLVSISHCKTHAVAMAIRSG